QLKSCELFFNQYETVIEQWPELKEKRLVHEIVRRMIDVLVSDLIENSNKNISDKTPADIHAVRNAGEVL
ncbi:MAG: deoxyguanosinetriphosphate triphosphohydrolase, partial [Gammaproteobacteria bacterium]|nr:deoxyguanosinetriphosphate triphosphohydrolase [Gammaproteobacteria bacterium]NIO63062.1 deoxyguanosinetriphosphate triphosphohydrolase [Gammaproteobacteria bacterium]NIT41787.1 deoxyguanosinetriphosphate triphosphohydrolase [Gammaproteobacteria bacterium]